MGNSRINKACLSFAFIFVLAACGGGGGGDSTDTGGPVVGTSILNGFFIDDAVQGLVYETGTNPLQTTDENGTFKFAVGQPITFRVDDVVIGSVASGLERITPGDFGTTSGTQIFRFLQSLDVTPGTPGIDLRGIDLPATPINFSQQDSFFENDAAVQAALLAAQAAGATGVLIDSATARANFLASTNRQITQQDFEGLVFYPVSVGVTNEPCLVFFNDNLTADSVCQDDITANPANAMETFTWSVANDEVIGDIDADTRTTLSRLGATGNRIHARIMTECLTCNPNLGPTIEVELQTLYTALPISEAAFSGKTLSLTDDGGTTTTASFAANLTATFDDGSGPPETAIWSVDTTRNVLLLQGTGAPGASSLLFVQIILIEGAIDAGRLVALNAFVSDTNANGTADQSEFDFAPVFDSVEVLTST